MILAGIGLTTWLVWALIGAVGGYMCGRLMTSGGVPAAVNVAVGIASAIGGGYAFIRWFGENDYGQPYRSVERWWCVLSCCGV